MLDWFTGSAGFDASGMALGRFLEFDRDGTVVRNRPRWETDRGSFESSIQVTVSAPTTGMMADAERLGIRCASRVLRISGNPTKYFQGHNVVGPPVRALGPIVRDVARALPSELRPADADDDSWFSLSRNRVDITTSVDLGSDQAVHNLLMDAESRTRSRQGRAVRSGTTVYWQKNSRRWTLKAYCKLCELEAHPPTVDIETRGALNDFAYGLLRIELTLRTPELKPLGTLDESLIWEYLGKVGVTGMATDERRTGWESVGRQARVTLAAWFGGTDVRKLMSTRTFYRHRKEILDNTGLDISFAPPNREPRPFLWGEELKKREVREVPPLIASTIYSPSKPWPVWGPTDLISVT